MTNEMVPTNESATADERDEFVELGKDIRRDIERLRKVQDDFGIPPVDRPLDEAELTAVVQKLAVAIKGIRRELHATVLSYLASAADNQLTVRGWAANHFSAILDDIGDLADRVAAVEGDTSQLIPSDADVLAKAVAGGKALAEQLLTLPDQTAEGRAKLDEVLQACTQAEAIIEQARMEFDEEEQEEADDGDEEEAE